MEVHLGPLELLDHRQVRGDKVIGVQVRDLHPAGGHPAQTAGAMLPHVARVGKQ